MSCAKPLCDFHPIRVAKHVPLPRDLAAQKSRRQFCESTVTCLVIVMYVF